jgi:hypothetical protein
LRTDLSEIYLEISKTPLANKLTLDFGNSAAIHLLLRNQDIDHLGYRPHGSAKLDVLELGEDS